MRLFYSVVLALLYASPAVAQSGVAAPILDAELRPPGFGSTYRSALGSHIAQDDVWAAVTGQPFSVPGSEGVVHLLRRDGDTWPLRQSLAPGGGAEVRFGAAIALKGTTLFVGAPGPEGPVATREGEVVVFTLDGTEWRESARIPSPAPLPSSRFGSFGRTLSFDGTRLLVGAPFQQERRGTVYVYERRSGTWALTATLDSPEATGERFGDDVAIAGTHAAVSAVQGDRRTVLTFERTGDAWAPTGELTQTLDAPVLFDASLDIDGDRLALGSPREIRNGRWGVTYVFGWTGGAWTRTDVLENTVAMTNGINRFGASLDLDGDRLLVGSPGAAQQALLFGFDGPGWTVRDTLDSPDPFVYEGFGEAVALAGPRGSEGLRALVGAPQTRVDGERGAGAVLAYRALPDSTFTQTAVTTLGPTRDGVWFGQAVALSGTRVAVGAPALGTSYGAKGSAYVFSVTNGVPAVEARVVGSAAFGSVVALGSDQLMVGAPTGNGGEAVAAYSRSGTTWTQTQTLYGVGVFGRALSLDGDRLLVGAPGVGGQPGRAFLYERQGTMWTLAAEFHPSVPENGASFGTSVALDGARVLVGAPYTAAGSSYGVVSVFERDGDRWLRVATLASDAPGPSGLFGASVAASGGRALVGAPSAPAGGGINGGTATVFDGLSWTPTATFGERAPGNTAGTQVALDGGRAIVSAPRDATDAGRVALYAFDGAQWIQTADLPSPHPAAGERFGSAIALSGRQFAVGGPAPPDSYAPGFGSVYLFHDAVTVADEAAPAADAPRLGRPAPNPASASARLVLTMPQPERVTASVFDALGREVQMLLHDAPVTGAVPLAVDARRLAPGLYVVRAVGETFAESVRLVVVR